MDPLSLLAGIAGVATAGIQVSKAMYDLISSIHGAPKEVSDIAREVSDLSSVLSELRRALREGRTLYRRRLLRRVSSAIQRIGQIHAEIHNLISGVEGFASLRWLFRRSKTTQLLYQIESHKSAINMLLHIMTLAVQTRTLLRPMANPSGTHIESDGQDDKAETDLLRQHAENSVRVSYQSLRNAVDEQGKRAQSSDTDQADEVVAQPDGIQSAELELWKQDSERDKLNTAQWLYELVFTSYAESLSCLPRSKFPDHDAEAEERPFHTADEASNGVVPAPTSRPRAHMQLAVMAQKPLEASSVVDELLAEWTTLTEAEIAGVVEDEGPGRVKTEVPPANADIPPVKPDVPPVKPDVLPVKTDVPPVRFKDAIGRKYSFPYHIFQTWAAAEEMIKEAFLNVDILGPHVRDGHYDLLGPNGEVIPPSAWEHVVEPGVTITMHMWSLEKSAAEMSHNGVPFRPNPGREQNQQEVTHPKPQVEVDKAPAGSQRDKGRPRENKRHRKNRGVPILGFIL